jgi:hypothetical protein
VYEPAVTLLIDTNPLYSRLLGQIYQAQRLTPPHSYIYCFAGSMRARGTLPGLYGMLRASVSTGYHEGEARLFAQAVHEVHEIAIDVLPTAMLARKLRMGEVLHLSAL